MSLFRRFSLFFCVALLAACASPPPKQSDGSSGVSVSAPVASASSGSSARRYVAADTSRTIDLTRPPTDAWDRIRRGFAIPNLDTDLAQQWTAHYAAYPHLVQRMAERAGKYLYHIIDEVNRRGLPTELALLPFIESAYDPNAYSRSQAAGLWQFIPSTGRYFKLKQDGWRDERRDLIASTRAALDYLTYLFDFQGDWYLALASYNWGEGAVRRAVDKNKANDLPTDYLSLTMPEQTRHYLPKLQAIKNIVADPAKYAVTLPPVADAPYFEVIPKTRSIDIALAARFAQMSVEEFRALNPAFKRSVILAEHQAKLLLPRDRVDTFKANLRAHQGPLTSWKGKSDSSDGPVGTHTVRAGDTLYDLARRYGTTVQTLRSLNNLANNTLRIGARLRLPNAAMRG